MQELFRGERMRSLVLSGGGAKGAYQCGILKHLLGELQVHYNILTGVSVGAINAAFLAMYPDGMEKQAADDLYKLWDQLNTLQVYKRFFPFGRFHALWEKSFFDSSPLHDLIHKNISLDRIRETEKQVCVGAVSLCSGKYSLFTQQDDDFIEAVIASASFPGLLSPVWIRNQWWADGGVKSVSPVAAALEIGADEIDVLMTSPETRNKNFIENPNILDIFKRTIDLASDKIMSNDLEKAIMYNRLAEAGVSKKKMVKLNVIRPDYNLTDNILDFDPIKLKKMMDLGYEDAKKKYMINDTNNMASGVGV